jgi:hypothetical protein
VKYEQNFLYYLQESWSSEWLMSLVKPRGVSRQIMLYVDEEGRLTGHLKLWGGGSMHSVG